MNYTVDNLITNIKLWTSSPEGQTAYSTDEYISILNDEMNSVVVPFLMSFYEEYLVKSFDYTIATGTTQYAIPEKAIGGILREIKVKDSNNNYWDLPRINPNNFEKYNDGFYLENNTVVLLNPGNYNGSTLRMYYFWQPNELVQSSEARQITNVVGNVVTVSNVPSTWSGNNLDIISGKPQFDVLVTKDSFTSVGSDITFTTTLPSTVAIGDWVALTGESPIPNFAYIIHNLIARSAAVVILDSMGDDKGASVAANKFAQYKEYVKSILNPRVQGESIKMTNTNSYLDVNRYGY